MDMDTIVAIATTMMDQTGIGIIRMSGEDSFSIINRMFRPINPNKKILEEKSHTIHYGHIMDGDEVVDEVLILLMRAPHTYTREDIVEIDCHGGNFVMRKILELAILNGARPADAGEFTKRAFLNGRIDLTQAESVMDVISSKNQFALKCSMSQLQGSLHDTIQSIRQKVIYQIALIESALDDPEHMSLDGYENQLGKVVCECKEEVEHLLDTCDNGKVLVEGIQTAIIGRPNAGKSSMMNFLLDKERAIVTDIAGTTRDLLEEHINLDGITLNIIDTAGIRNSQDVIEQIGVQRAKESLEGADLVLYIVDSSLPLDENDFKIMDWIQDKKAIVVLNKSDLETVTTEDMITAHLNFPIVKVSAKEREGLDELKEVIKNLFFHGEINFHEEVYITNARHKAALLHAKKSLSNVLDSIAMGMPEDFFSIDLMSANQELGSILGESVEDDVINEIFSKFCVGK